VPSLVQQVYTAACGQQHADTSSCLAHLVALLRGAGKSATALPLAQRALDIKQKLLGDSHLEVALALQTVAELMSDMGRWVGPLSCTPVMVADW
jgi:hypothetical protein